jgi:uncharacterized protein
MAGEALHEDKEVLGPEILDRHRAISTVMEELEAIDWYDQRIAASANDQLRAILAHNRDEEKEHASMLLEWLRRHDSGFDKYFRRFMFTSGPIREIADAAEGEGDAGSAGSPAAPPAGSGDGSLGIGSLRRGGRGA